ncbi:hypothetical protein EDD22DRAFT_850209 [Suillus occidentalis]|nr:hypothetical protein EDD22DRAFT_850209 [Suillus occidentalis]
MFPPTPNSKFSFRVATGPQTPSYTPESKCSDLPYSRTTSYEDQSLFERLSGWLGMPTWAFYKTLALELSNALSTTWKPSANVIACSTTPHVGKSRNTQVCDNSMASVRRTDAVLVIVNDANGMRGDQCPDGILQCSGLLLGEDHGQSGT